jgi:flagellar brake protein
MLNTAMPVAPPAADFPAAVDYEQFLISSRLEISQILHAIMRQGSLITASLGGSDFFLTSIVSVDADGGHLMIECDRNGMHTERVLGKRRLPCSTTLDKIKIQFACNGVEAATYGGNSTYKVGFPDDLLRLQRREYFRMPTPVVTPVKCALTVAHGGRRGNIELNLIDISCGGISLLMPPDVFTPQPGACFDCTLHLPGTSALRTRVQARNTFELKLANGKLTRRTGFAFIDLRENLHATIQRYIMNLERQRKSRYEI